LTHLITTRNLIYPLLVFVGVLLNACTAYSPLQITPDVDLEGLQTKSRENVAVSVAILTDEESHKHFGADLGSRGLQALWISVSNGSPNRLWFIRNSVDADFYSPDEAALLLRSEVSGSDFEQMRQHFRDETIRVLLKPMTITEGFIFLPRVEGGRYLDIRLAKDAYQLETRRESRVEQEEGTFNELRFGFAVPLPDGDFDYERLDTEHSYAGTQLPDIDLDMLRERLEQLPCCSADKDGQTHGDPLNVVMVGESPDVLNSLSRSGWSFTHRITPGSVMRMAGAAMEGKPYPVAPVSSLYLFGRKQDFALQRARRNIAQRNHMRMWLAPFTFEGKQVWIGQVSRDIGIRVTPKSPTLTTHIIDPEVDLTREYLLHSLLAEGFVDRFGFVTGSKQAPITEPAENLMGDPYFSDGMRLLIILSPHPIPYSKVRSLVWEQSSAPVAEGQTDAAERYVRPIGTLENELN